MKKQIIKFIIVIVALNAIISFAKTFDGKKTTIYNTLTKESRESGYCDLNDVICDGEELPEIEQVGAYNKQGEFTAYNATEAQCDDSPEIMASNKRIYAGAIACPGFYEFGTKIDVKGIGVFTCEDRMNIRYRDGEYFDILLEKNDEAKMFGRQQLAYRIIK